MSVVGSLFGSRSQQMDRAQMISQHAAALRDLRHESRGRDTSGRQHRGFLLFLCGQRDADQWLDGRAGQTSDDRESKHSAVRSPARTALLVSGAAEGRHQVGPEKQMPLPCEVPY